MPVTISTEIDQFLVKYNEEVCGHALKLRNVLLRFLPGITEQLDLPAKMIVYYYGQKYAELICVMIPSKNGLKLGFNRGAQLPDPYQLLKGKGKVSRYVEIKSPDQIESPELKQLLLTALSVYYASNSQGK